MGGDRGGADTDDATHSLREVTTTTAAAAAVLLTYAGHTHKDKTDRQTPVSGLNSSNMTNSPNRELTGLRTQDSGTPD